LFGNNPIRPVTRNPNQLSVEECFYTLQGEGPFAGSPALFIRLSGCNLACTFCDTQFEVMAETTADVIAVVKDICARFTLKQRRFVVLTGGEPLRQDPVLLLQALRHSGTQRVQIETAGTVWPSTLESLVWSQFVTLVCSPKMPKIHPTVRANCRHYKYIIRAGQVDPQDGLPNWPTQAKYGVDAVHSPDHIWRQLGPEDTVWLSPCDDYDPGANKANLFAARDSCLKHGYHLTLQMHKLVELP
jgi:7-carboxy-7-deazaguanine synthase